MPYYYLVQILKSTYGYKEYLENQNNKSLLEFARFRRALAEDLYENKEKYSEELLKLYREMNFDAVQ